MAYVFVVLCRLSVKSTVLVTGSGCVFTSFTKPATTSRNVDLNCSESSVSIACYGLHACYLFDFVVLGVRWNRKAVDQLGYSLHWSCGGCLEVKGEYYQTAPCCVVYDSCAHKYEQLLNLCLVSIRLVFVFFKALLFLCVSVLIWIWFCVVSFVGFSFFSTEPRNWLGRTFPK